MGEPAGTTQEFSSKMDLLFSMLKPGWKTKASKIELKLDPERTIKEIVNFLVKKLVEDSRANSGKIVEALVGKIFGREKAGEATPIHRWDYSKPFHKNISELKNQYVYKYKRMSKDERKSVDEDVRELYDKAGFLVDTCYSEERAKALEKNLKVLGLVDDGKVKWELLMMLLSAYVNSAASFESNLDSEWFLTLLRRFLQNKGEENIEITTCPGKGDAAALAYYIINLISNLISPDTPPPTITIEPNILISYVKSLLDAP